MSATFARYDPGRPPSGAESDHPTRAQEDRKGYISTNGGNSDFPLLGAVATSRVSQLTVGSPSVSVIKNSLNMDAIFQHLTDAQKEAVSHIDGPMLILAGPGSGKTRVVTRDRKSD